MSEYVRRDVRQSRLVRLKPDSTDSLKPDPATHGMDIQVDIWLRGDNHATTEVIAPVTREPRAWTEGDVASVLIGMLRALDRAKNPDAPADRPVGLRGFSWIVNPFESGGVVIALEMTLGAVVAGPFDVSESVLSGMIQRIVDADRTAQSTVH